MVILYCYKVNSFEGEAFRIWFFMWIIDNSFSESLVFTTIRSLFPFLYRWSKHFCEKIPFIDNDKILNYICNFYFIPHSSRLKHSLWHCFFKDCGLFRDIAISICGTRGVLGTMWNSCVFLHAESALFSVARVWEEARPPSVYPIVISCILLSTDSCHQPCNDHGKLFTSCRTKIFVDANIKSLSQNMS